MRALAAILTLLVIVGRPASLHADDLILPELPQTGDTPDSEPPPPNTTSFELDDETGEIEAAVGTGGTSGTGVAEHSNEPPCTWHRATIGEVITSTAGGEVDPTLNPNAQAEVTYGNVAHLAWWRQCGNNPPELVLLAPIDPIDLVPGAADRVRDYLPSPSPNINPDPATGGFVNLGIWYAINDPDETQVRASLPGVWAEATGTLTGISIDPGTGDPPIDCPGLGVPIETVDPTLETVEQGPCGYTYRASSPDDAPYQMTITNIYEVTWRTSDGRSGTLGESRRPLTIPFDIDEIQTIGGR